MAWNNNSKVRDAGEYAKKHGFNKVMIVTEDQDGRIGYVSYGSDAQGCKEAKHLAEIGHKAIYDYLCSQI